MQYIVTTIKTCLFAIVVVHSIHAQEWVKDGGSYVKDGELVLKRPDGSSVGVTLNNSLPKRGSLGRTPNIMVLNSGGAYNFGLGIKLNNGDYYLQEQDLDVYVRLSEVDFNEKFDASVDDLESLDQYESQNSSSSCTLNTSFTDVNHIAFNNGSSCSSNLSITNQVFPTYKDSDGDRCTASAQGANCSGNLNTNSQYCAFGSFGVSGAQVGASIPKLGGGASCNGSAHDYKSGGCSAVDPLSVSYSRSLSLNHTADSWVRYKTTMDGVLRGFGRSKAVCGLTVNYTYRWVMPDGSMSSTWSNFATSSIWWSQIHQIYLGWGGEGTPIYMIGDTTAGAVITQDVAHAPVAIVFNIKKK